MNFLKSKIKRKDIILTLNSIAHMMEAGLSKEEAVDSMITEQSKRKVKSNRLLLLLQEGFREGYRFSEVFKSNENIIGVGMWRQLEVAERTGREFDCLYRIVAQLKRNSKVFSKLKGAAVYPVVILIIALAVCYYLLSTTIPQMQEMLLEFDAELPAVTQAVMYLGDLLNEQGPLMLILVISMSSFIAWVLKHPLKHASNKLIISLPVLGDVSKNVNFALVYQLIVDMMNNGSHIVECLRVAAGSCNNMFIRQELFAACDAMEREGIDIAEGLLQTKSLPEDDRIMISVGQRSNRLRDILVDMARMKMETAEESIAILVDLMSPILMVVVGSIIGLLVFAVYMPMLSLSQAIA